MSKSKKSTKRRIQPPRQARGTHLDRIAVLDRKHPAPRPIGEKRGTGKPFIRLETVNAITYQLRPNGLRLTHHETCAHTICMEEAETFIRMWLGLPPEDYCKILQLRHSFPQDTKPGVPHHKTF